jgi:hypothetical protein
VRVDGQEPDMRRERWTSGRLVAKSIFIKDAKRILSNLVVDDLDKELARRGHRFCRYADDCNIYVRSRRAGERVMASVSRFLTNKLRLRVNEAKSAVARAEERKFLGFSISNDGSERRIAPRALDKFKGQIRDMTRRTRGFGLQQLIKELKPYIVGWRGPTGAAQQLFRLARSSPNLCARPSLTRSNRRGTDPYARWCGRGGAARHPPIPI